MVCVTTTLNDHVLHMLYDVIFPELLQLKTLKWINLVLGLTQENSIENSIQAHLPYILNYNSPCYYFSSLP